jgi:hypothetical protein
MKLPNPLPPDRMTPAERRAELAHILALGIVRLRGHRDTNNSNALRDIPLDFPPTKSGHGRASRKKGKCP